MGVNGNGRPATRVVKIRVRRYDPETGRRWWQEYRVEAKKGTTVLDALLKIKAEQDHTLAMRYSCRMGACGSCGMLINKMPRLACETQLLELGTDTVTIEPLPNFPVLRDLITDFGDFFKKHRDIMPYIVRESKKENEEPYREYYMPPEELNKIIRYSHCIMCGLCYAACPVVAIDKKFLGPQALGQAYRWVTDVRDEGLRLRLEKVDDKHGVWRCHFAGSCSAACPKGVDPAQGIQLLRSKLVALTAGARREKKPTHVATPTTVRYVDVGDAPKPTVEDKSLLVKHLEETAQELEQDLPYVAQALRDYLRTITSS